MNSEYQIPPTILTLLNGIKTPTAGKIFKKAVSLHRDWNALQESAISSAGIADDCVGAKHLSYRTTRRHFLRQLIRSGLKAPAEPSCRVPTYIVYFFKFILGGDFS